MIILFLPHNLKLKIRGYPPVKLLINLIVFVIFISIIFSAAIVIVEKVSILDAVYLVWQTASTVGYGVSTPESALGIILTMFLGTIAFGVLGTLIAAIVEVCKYFSDRRRLGMSKNPHEDGYIFFNLPSVEKFLTLVKELREIEPNVGICVVDNQVEELPPVISILNNIHFMNDKALQRNYERMGVRENKAIVIFPSNFSDSDSDGETWAISEHLLKYKKDVKIVAFLLDPENSYMFDKRVKLIWENVSILSVVQELQDAGTAEIIQNLLCNTVGANPQTVIPKRIIGWTWQEFCYACLFVSEELNVLVNPFAIIHANETKTCPPFRQQIQERDTISIIAYPGFNWEEFENALSDWKSKQTLNLQAQIFKKEKKKPKRIFRIVLFWVAIGILTLICIILMGVISVLK